jgi:hypothetical protein
MPTRPGLPAKDLTGDFDKFADFMRRLVAVPHSEVKAKLDAEKQAKQRQKKPVSSLASHAKIRIPFSQLASHLCG